MKNVLFVLPFLGYTGADRVIFTLLNNLDRNKINPFLLVHSDSDEKSGLIKHLQSDVTTISINVNGRISRNLPKIFFGIRSAIKKNNIDTVLISDGTLNASLSPFLSLFGDVKIVARESNLPSLFETKIIVKYLYRTFYRNYDKIIVQSNDMYNDLIYKMSIPEDKVIKINNPLDYNYIKNRSRENSEYELPKDKINLLSIGRLTYQKGYDLLFEALAKLKDKSYHLTLVGRGEDRDALYNLSIQLDILDQITFIDQTDNPYSLMRQAHVFISSSRWEGYPNAVIEALACGIPVVANKYPGGINEIINSANGVICDISTELASGLEQVLKLKDVDYDHNKLISIFKSYENELTS